MATTPVVIRESPRPAGVPMTSDAGKVEAETKQYARELSKALRALYVQVQDLAAKVTATTVGTSGSSTSEAAVTDEMQKINVPTTPVADGDMVIFSGNSGRHVKSGGKPAGGTAVVPKNFSILLDMAVLNPGAGTTINVDVNITSMGLIGSAGGGAGSPGDNLPNKIVAAYDNLSVSNSASNARFVVFKSDATALPAIGVYRVNFMVFP